MKFKVVSKRLIYIDEGYNITKGENNNELITIEMPRYPNGTDTDYLSLSHRLTVTSVKDSTIAACEILIKEELNNNKLRLSCPVTHNISSIGEEAFFKVTSVGSNNFIDITECATPIKINGNTDGDRLPSDIDIEGIISLAQLAAQKADEAAKNADVAAKNADVAAKSADVAAKSADVAAKNADIAAQITSDAAQKSENAVENVKDLVNEAHLSPASETSAGYVMVDGETITATEDGIISASKSITETQNLVVQIAHPNNYLIYDNAGKPSVMVAIPKFYLDEVIKGASHTVHPAFIINGVVQDVIYISKYQNIVENGRAYSLPMKNPAGNLTFDQAWDYCKNKGDGWHLMTNAEWAAIALWCRKNGFMPKGNNNYGKDISEIDLPQKAIPAAYDGSGQITKVLTGSGPASWHHDGSFAGIADLIGNLAEFVSGLRLNNGEIQVISDNDAAVNNTVWKAIAPDGTLVEPETDSSIHYSNGIYGTKFSNISVTPVAAGLGISLLESLCLLPHENETSDYYGDKVWTQKNGICVAIRGGGYSHKSDSGLFMINLSNAITYKFTGLGFRCAYYGNI